MSVKVMSAVWEYGPADSTQRFVLLALADNASDDGGNAYPSIQEIARKCALSERTVIRTLDKLVAAGYLSRRRRQYTSNLYQIVLDKLVSDKLSLSNVTNCHPVSDNVSLSNVTDCHLGGDTVSPDPSINHPINHQGNRGRGKRAPNAAEFTPVPAEVRQAKAARGLDEPEPALVAEAPPAIRLLARLTTYWPGDDVAPALVDRLGDTPDETALAAAVELWRLSGNKPTNWLGIIDWYDELRRDPAWTPQKRFRNGKAPKTAAPAVVLKEIEPGLY